MSDEQEIKYNIQVVFVTYNEQVTIVHSYDEQGYFTCGQDFVLKI